MYNILKCATCPWGMEAVGAFYADIEAFYFFCLYTPILVNMNRARWRDNIF